MLLWLVGGKLCENSNPLQGLRQLMAQHGEAIYIIEVELEMDTSQTVKRMEKLGPNPTMCYLATWTENAVNFKLKLSKNWKRKPKKNEVKMESATK